MFSRLSCWSVLLVSLFALSACGGGGGGNSTPSFTISGTVSGLTGTGLVLQNNGGDNLSISASGSFSFSSKIADGGGYAVTVLTSPSAPRQLCTVTNGTGTIAGADVTDVSVSCVNVYTISGTVSGLTGSGLVLQNSGGDDLSISANGSFSFTTTLFAAESYDVTVLTQPTTPAQVCTVTNGSGTVAAANITNVSVSCANTYNISGIVSGLTGSGLVLQNNSSDNLSISTDGSFSFTTPLFDADIYAVTILTQPSSPAQNCVVTNGNGTVGGSDVSDIEVLCGNYWTWMSGNNTSAQPGVYGTKGVADAANVPGARYSSISWIDSNDKLWLFGGGDGLYYYYYNDLWKYDGVNWTWVSGTNAVNQPGVYGVKSNADVANVPGARDNAVSWIDSSNNLWLFGGRGYDSVGSLLGHLNDLWKFDGTQWTWVSGTNAINQPGVYGVKSTADAANVPGGRSDAVSWIDSSNNFWLFGGWGYDSAGNLGRLNDLWKYDGTNWIWVSGSNVRDQAGVYGIRGTSDAANVPGGRAGASSWSDSNGNVWLFGGQGYDNAGVSLGLLNDLWMFDGVQWTWVAGTNVINQTGVYGTKGIADTANLPGARCEATTWVDSSDTLWLFGGLSTGVSRLFNDMWRFDGSDWTWVSGSNTTSRHLNVYGTLGTPSAANVPEGRAEVSSWIDSSGDLWLFGGLTHMDNAGGWYNNDLWRYTP